MSLNEALNPSETMPSGAAAPARWLGSLHPKLAAWLQKSADDEAAAPPFMQHGGRSDSELTQAGLPRESVVRDPGEGSEQALEQRTATDAPNSPSLELSTGRQSISPGATALAFETAAVLIMLLAVVAILAPSLVLGDPTSTAARSGNAAAAAQQSTDRF